MQRYPSYAVILIQFFALTAFAQAPDSRRARSAESLPAFPAPKQQAEPSKITVTAAPGKGFAIATEDDRFSMTIRTRAQLRNTFTRDSAGSTNEINVKTLRFVTQGHVLDPDLKFMIQLAFGAGDFERDNSSPIFDAFVEYVGLRDLNVRVGQYFVPFDRARTMREFALQMVDRPLAVRELTLDRDIGLMLSSTNLFNTKFLGYHLFIGGGEGRNRLGGQKMGPLAVARIIIRPWGTFDDDNEGDLTRESRVRIAFGIGGAYNYATNRQYSTYGNTFTVGTADYAHGATDLVLKYSGFSLLAEGVLRRARHHFMEGVIDGMTRREWTRSGYGYLVQTGMMVHALMEITARWEQLFAWGNTDPAFRHFVDAQGNQVGTGFNLYLNGHQFKIQTDYFYIFGEQISEGRHVARLQLDASF